MYPCAVGAFLGIDEVAVLVVFSGLAVAHPHYHNNQECKHAHAY